MSYADLRAMPRTRLTTVHECTGNGRSFFGSQQGTPAAGTQWTLGAVGAVAWEGVRLVDRAEADRPRPARRLGHGHGPRRRLRHRRCRLRTGPAAVPDQQGPGRRARSSGAPTVTTCCPTTATRSGCSCPGWVGIGSIKWLGSLEVSTTEQTSPWNTKWYRMTGGSYPPDSPPLTVNPVRSAFELAWGASLVQRRAAAADRPVVERRRARSRGSTSAPTAAPPGTAPTSAETVVARPGRSGSTSGVVRSAVTTSSWPARPTSRAGSSRW